ncbi:MAG TPA: GldG family protein, partial [archaeon]|nr:GldG family protein [archaeon]
MRQTIKTIGYVSPVVFFLGLGIYYVNGLWGFFSIGFTSLGAAAGLLYVVFFFDDLREIFSARSFRSGTNTLLVTSLVLSLLVIMNVIGYRHFIWRDITIAKKFELSPLTLNILDQIKKEKRDVYITAFHWINVDRNLSIAQNETLIRQNRERERKLRDLLAVYSSVNPSVQYRFVDPNRDIMLQRQYNIGRYRDNVTVVECGESQEMVVNMETEEQLTNAFIKVLSGEKRVVYFLEGHQEHGIDDGSGEGYMMAAAAIRDQSYEVKALNVMEEDGVPGNCRALVITGARKTLMPEEVRLIDDYLEKGGRVMVCLDPEYETGMEEWLLGWGVRTGNDMVVDNSAAGVRQGAGPTEPLLYSYDKEHPITKHLMKAFTTMPTVRSVRPVENLPEEIELTVLASTSENSWGETDRTALAVKSPTFDPQDMSGPVPVAVA